MKIRLAVHIGGAYEDSINFPSYSHRSILNRRNDRNCWTKLQSSEQLPANPSIYFSKEQTTREVIESLSKKFNFYRFNGTILDLYNLKTSESEEVYIENRLVLHKIKSDGLEPEKEVVPWALVFMTDSKTPNIPKGLSSFSSETFLEPTDWKFMLPA